MSHPVDSWWQAFREATDRLDALFRGEAEWDLPEWMHEHLGGIDPRLMWEFGPAVERAGHRLVITPEGERSLRPLVRAILAAAPELEGWEFYGYRLPEDAESAHATIEARTGLSIAGASCQIRPAKFNFVDVRFVLGETTADEDDQRHAAFVAAESMLGEEMLDRWVGVIDVGGSPDPEWPDPLPIDELSNGFETVRDELLDGLPDRPWHARDPDEANGAVLKLEPREAESYPGQSDLIAFSTTALDAHENALRGLAFDSVRHSRHGERFCYLKIDGRGGLESTPWDDRGDIEDAIDSAIRGACLGAVVGGGTGLVHSYVELALTDVRGAWSAIRETLREGDLDRNTWLLFHDTDDALLWRGLYDDTPPPPRRDEE